MHDAIATASYRPRSLPSLRRRLVALCLAAFAPACLAEEPRGLAPSPPRATTVEVDLFARPLPEIPLPYDLATRHDPSSPTGLRINASMIAPTEMERRVREKIDQIDGWGVFQPITIPFTGPLDVKSIIAGHRDIDYEPSNDVIYLLNIDRTSAEFGRLHHLDLGNGNFPVVLEQRDLYWKNDPRGFALSLLYEEADEDSNRNGRLDPGEDADGDGVLDRPNYLTGSRPARDDLAGRADALMTFYERETNTLIARPLIPLAERTRYAVVVTTRLKDAKGEPVGSPYPYINHTADNAALEPLVEVLPAGLTLEQVAFAFTFTTQSITSDIVAVRDGLYEQGVQAHLGRDFPPQIDELLTLRGEKAFPAGSNLQLVYSEQLTFSYELIIEQVLGFGRDSQPHKQLIESQRYIDFHVMGSFRSPQLFWREDPAGEPLPLDAQSWPPDLHRNVAPARAETVHFWLTVPREEVSARGAGKPVPVAIVGHGYTSSRVEMIAFAGELAKHGVATIAIDNVSHQLGVGEAEQVLVKGIFAAKGLEPFAESLFFGRGTDQDGDGSVDSGVDFWSAYLFHTRDVVRQSMLDYMQLVKILRTFDGTKRWTLGPDGGGLAGDFNGDGVVDIGGAAPISMTGGSLGGIMSMVMGSVEPELDAVIPISGGGGLSDIGIRSRQGGVPQAFFLRTMGPLFVGTLANSGQLELETVVVSLNRDKTVPIATVSGVGVGDAVVVENLESHERACGYVLADGTFRIPLESDRGDRLRIRFYPKAAIAIDGDDDARCTVDAAQQVKAEVARFERAGSFEQTSWEAGAELVALAEGLGLRRNSPNIRRFVGLGQLVLDRADPAVLGRHMLREPLTYANGQRTGSHALVVSTIGDMAVPVSSGITFARAVGLIDYLKSDARYGKSPNQVLIDTYTAESVHNLRRYRDDDGQGVHLDVDDFSGGTDLHGRQVPRLDPPLRLVREPDEQGGISAAIFPLSDKQGQHGFDQPGQQIEKMRDRCRDKCAASGKGQCGCNEIALRTHFDIGTFMGNVTSRYASSGGRELSFDLCNARDDCADIPPPPAPRDALK